MGLGLQWFCWWYGLAFHGIFAKFHWEIDSVSFEPHFKSSLPWLADVCMSMISEDHAAEGTEIYFPFYFLVEHSAQTILDHLNRIRSDFQSLPRNSKRRTSLNKQSLHRHCSVSLSFPLCTTQAQWFLDAQDKANAFATCWLLTDVMPPEIKW